MRGCVLETCFLTSQWREFGICAGDGSFSPLRAPRCWHVAVQAHGAWRGYRVSPLPPVLPHRGPEPLESLGGRERKMAVWLPVLASPPHDARSRPFQIGDFGVSCPRVRSPGESVCQEPSSKSVVSGCSSSLPPSLRAHVFGTRACAGTRLSHHAARGWAPGILKESGRGSGFHVFRCHLIFIQGLRFG